MLFASVAALFFTFTTATPLFFGYGSKSIDINVGSINGKTKNGIDSFRGVPYAEPPVGDLRLRPPKHIRSE
jgi:carboxylesterase type B